MTFAQAFDMGAALMLAFFAVRGAMRGLTGEILSLLGLIAAVLGGWKFARPLSALVRDYFPAFNPTVTDLACAAVIFIGVSLAFSVVGKIMKAIVKAAKLSFLDHIGGAVSGSARAFVLVLCVYGVVSVFPAIPGDWMKDSVAMKGASAVWPSVYRIMTDKGWIDTRFMTPYGVAPDGVTPYGDRILPDYLTPVSTPSD